MVRIFIFRDTFALTTVKSFKPWIGYINIGEVTAIINKMVTGIFPFNISSNTSGHRPKP